jgi:two-component system, response regulator
VNTNQLAEILVVEDNADESFLLTRQLARAGMEDCVTVIGDGQDALECLLQSSIPPRVVFLDLRLPRMSGIEILKRLREEERLRLVPVVIMTGSIEPKDTEECDRLGVTAYLPKPVDLSTFIKIVAHTFPKQVSTSE